MKVSVIVPIYKVERFIGRCAESLLKQTLQDVEYIFVDDATPDRSMDVLADVIASFPNRKNNITIIHHEKNQGLPAARNTGLSVAQGEYVFHCDSDDFVEPDMLERLYETARTQDADIVWCDWYLSFETNERYMKQPSYSTPMEALKAMLGGAMKYNVWNKLAKRSLYVENMVSFPSGYGMGEDMTMMMLFAVARKVSYINKAYYHYVKTNTGSFCQTYSERHLEELLYNVKRIEIFIHERYGQSMERELAFFKLETKFPFLISNGKRRQYQLWTDWFPEANAYIKQNGNISMRSRLIQQCAANGWFGIVRIYYDVVMCLVYRLLYN